MKRALIRVAVALILTIFVYFQCGQLVASVLDHFFVSEWQFVKISDLEISQMNPLQESAQLRFLCKEPFTLLDEQMISTRLLATISNIQIDSIGEVSIRIGKELVVVGSAQQWDEVWGWQGFNPDADATISLAVRHGYFFWLTFSKAPYFYELEWRRNTYYLFEWTESTGTGFRIAGRGEPEYRTGWGVYSSWNSNGAFELAMGDVSSLN